MNNIIDDEVVICVEGLWKRYGLPPNESLRHQIKRYLRAIRHGTKALADKPNWNKNDGGLWSLQDINFEVQKGKVLGVIGLNGSGKSTLLKILTLTSPATYGKISIKGRIFSMIDLNAGMNMELSGRENINLLGILFGYSPRWIIANLPKIEAFCELGEWFDRPVWQYSTGMVARLGFALAINANSDVLLVDEILAVGDYTFQKKCIAEMENLIKSGVTVVFVSHNPYLIERISDQVLWLHHGAIKGLGDPSTIVKQYLAEAFKQSKQTKLNTDDGKIIEQGSHQELLKNDLRIRRVEMLSQEGLPIDVANTGEPITFRLHYHTKTSVVEPNFAIRFIDQQNTIVLALEATEYYRDMILTNDGFIDFIIPYFPLVNNIYMLQIKVGGPVQVDMIENAMNVVVSTPGALLLRGARLGLIHTQFSVTFSDAGA